MSFPEPREFQGVAHDNLRKGVVDGHRCQMLMAPTGSGKCLGIDTPILMYDGTIKKVQDVVVGDQLIGPDSLPRNVLSVCSGNELLFKITPIKGEPYIVNKSHILSLKKTGGTDGIFLSSGAKVKSDADIVNVNVEVFATSSKTAKHCLKGWRSGAINFNFEAEDFLLLDPYWLGAWLGDGSKDAVILHKPMCNMVKYWIASAERYGLRVAELNANTEKCSAWRLVSNDRTEKGHLFNIFLEKLDYYNLRKNKHVPIEFKVASIKDRLSLIAGLLDSDGSLSHNGFDWISVSETLANDMVFLCRSVGLAAYVKPCKKGIKTTGFIGNYYRVSISGDTDKIPCLDKIARPRLQKKRHLVHGISVKPIGSGDYYGFEIDGDHLFLLGDFTVTHNTFIGLRIASEALKKGKRAVFVCDRTTLINQTSATADRYGLSEHGVIQASHWRTDYSKRFQIASAQTLARRKWPEADVIIVDEAHTQLKAWTEHIPNTDAMVIGLSATPFSAGLGLLFSNLVNASTMAELTKQGVLVPMRVFSCTKPDMQGAATSGGEWTPAAAAERGMSVLGDVVTEWHKYGENRKTIVFGATIAHCESLCAQFVDSGVMAAVFTADTPQSERDELLKEYRKLDSKLKVLISVEALAKGFDVQSVSCIADARPLRKSLSTAIQMWGRGLRSDTENGKTDCILLDFSGNILRFKEDFERIYHEGLDALDMGEKLDKTVRKDDEEKEDKACPSCGYKPFFKNCMACGHKHVAMPEVDVGAGVMHEITIGGKVVAENKRHLWEQCVAYVLGHGNETTRQGRAAHIYKDVTGNWPPRDYMVEFTQPAPISKEVLSRIKAKQIAYAFGKKKEVEMAKLEKSMV